ncbi:MAG: dicarboxylate/amino acid:cation symporter [Thermoanaerobaculaceae bacterium]|nr:dicarboxylate/amino acid:cation symporter [Thermoanaerobaculaceae bacterium]MDI9621782.1 dicarboxylate/amino acid:cation symporter [Acidobacteriota bacterium]NLH11334.1 dicarboxylate/amino acid:cation symporter [Holophagae bacterium]
MKLHTRILIGLVAGATAGVATNLLIGTGPMTHKVVSFVTEPIGKLWLAALIMVVIPLILSTLSVGVASLGDLKRLGRIGLVTAGCFLGLTALSTSLGLTVMNTIAPGRSLPEEVKTELMATYKGQADEAMGLGSRAFNIDLLYSVIPRNPVQAAASGNMLGVIFFAVMLGAAMALLPAEKAAPLQRVLASLGHVTVAIIELVMRVAPVGVFCLIFSVTARFGLHLLVSLSAFVVTVVGSLAFFQFVGYTLVLWLVARHPPLDFFRKARLVMITAFTTSSSNATLPTTMRVAEQKVGIPREISAFVLPLGATMNMNGTALFEGATVLFLAQVFGVNLGLGQQAVVVLMSVVTAIGVAGIPGGSIPLLMMVLAMVGVPAEGIAIVLGVDRLLDMCRTVLNVTGDLVTATIVTRAERMTLQPDPLAQE